MTGQMALAAVKHELGHRGPFTHITRSAGFMVIDYDANFIATVDSRLLADFIVESLNTEEGETK